MNLTKLFEIQRKLDEHIIGEHNLQGVDLLDKKILALQVELGELANEWRGFKFWSNDQEPRTDHKCAVCEGEGSITLLTEPINDGEKVTFIECKYCNGDGYLDKNPLLEEYVDCLHFILSIGIEAYSDEQIHNLGVIKLDNVTDQFLHMFMQVSGFIDFTRYVCIIETFLGLGEMLGFTWGQIEQGYLDKNKINHERQVQGY